MNGERFHVNAPPLCLQPGNDWSCLSRFPPRRPGLTSVRLSRSFPVFNVLESLNDLLGINWTCCIWKGFRWSSRPAVTSNSPPDLPPARISHLPWRWILLDVTIKKKGWRAFMFLQNGIKQFWCGQKRGISGVEVPQSAFTQTLEEDVQSQRRGLLWLVLPLSSGCVQSDELYVILVSLA